MGLRQRTVAPTEASDINSEGASTDQERIDALAAHVQEYHADGGAGTPGIAVTYYLDEVRNKYLSHQIFKVPFYRKDNVKRQYMNYMPDIRSSNVPYRLLGTYDFCVVGFEMYNVAEVSGTIMDVRDESTGFASILPINIPVLATEYYDETVDITLTSGAGLCAYIEDNTLTDPVLILNIRQIFVP